MRYTLRRFVRTQPETVAARILERAPASELTLHPRQPEIVEQLRGALA